ncbi:MAG: PKD domain-containing protein [bacterium]|nr:PKD domain-containing protein [bacterium]
MWQGRSLWSLLVAFICIAPLCFAAEVNVAGKDRAAIQSAIDDAAPGDTVLLPAGEFLVDGAVALKPGICLKGAGQDETVLRFAGDALSAMVSVSGCEDTELCHLTLDADMSTNVTQGIEGSNARRVHIHHVTIRDIGDTKTFGPHGIHFTGQNPSRERGVTDSVIDHCRIENVGVNRPYGGGIRLSWGSSRNRVEDNTIDHTGRGGIFADNGSSDIVIRRNTVARSGGTGLGIEVWLECDRCVIEDNRIDHWLSIGSADYCAVRRNTISDHSGIHKFCGIEGIGSYGVYTDNVIDGGAKIGLSVSAPRPKEYMFWGRNAVSACNQWGAQFQGEKGGVTYQYFHACTFSDMPVGLGDVKYPGDEGHGFRIVGNMNHAVWEDCVFRDNTRLGLQIMGANVDHLRFVRCTIADNTGRAVSRVGAYKALEWDDCTVAGNADDSLPPAKPFSPPPAVAFEVKGEARVGSPVRFSSEPGEIAAVLWDFDDGLPCAEKDTTHTYDKPGSYRVTLIAWDAAGSAARADRVINVAR